MTSIQSALEIFDSRKLEIPMEQSQIRNFCIIAHIDHGKSTLADRLIERTNTVASRDMRSQLLDTMDLERERGITIKLQPVRMVYEHPEQGARSKEQGATITQLLPIAHGSLPFAPSRYELNLIDTPGHVDFTYEVSRSLAAVEGAVLLVDATQGIQAQTLTTLHQAQAQGLTIIPAINKIDLPHAEPEATAQEVMALLGVTDNEILFVSGKTGEGVGELLTAIVERIPAPSGNPTAPLRALIFDSRFDTYRGVVVSVRIVDGSLPKRTPIKLLVTGAVDAADEVGHLTPSLAADSTLDTGQIGYVVTGLKNVSQARVGDTITTVDNSATSGLPGYQEVYPMVYAGLFPSDGDVNVLRTALEKLGLNDASLMFEPDSSEAFGLGFRCGFLGLLHLDIVRERLEREFQITPITTTPSVAYKERSENGRPEYAEPWVRAEIVTPQTYVGNLMTLCQERRGNFLNTDYLGDRALLHYELPLSEIIVDFYDALKSVSAGYASLNYELIGYREGNLVKLTVLIAGDPVDVLSQIVHRDQAFSKGQEIVKRLKDLIPRQNFEIALQAAVGGKIVARETVSAVRKDVTAGLYGGDVTRKNKLLKKQAEGKKKMRKLGKVDIPSDVFTKLLKRGE